jgi:para-aminobenzoate synthetase component 1
MLDVKDKNHFIITTHTQRLQNKMLNWANRFNIFCLLQSNGYASTEGDSFEVLLAAGAHHIVTLDHPLDFSELKRFSQQHPSWLFGHLNYPSEKKDPSGFPQACFFSPQHLITLRDGAIEVLHTIGDATALMQDIEASFDQIASSASEHHQVLHRISKTEYLEKIDRLKYHLQRGDCYEINYCQEFFIDDIEINALTIFQDLNRISPNPFASLYKHQDSFCLCASPERFIKRTGNRVISQPIKGTIKRNLEDAGKDAMLKEQLAQSEKDKSENVMIVDLVRNDLSRICTEGSVKVPELFGIHSFPQVHHMISTIQGEVKADAHWTEIVDACFPMGSMTGAPKIKVMELIEAYEATPRGLFSGTIGYVTPTGDFDFNVVIRSIFFNQSAQYLRFLSGGGITIHSEPESEYEESMAKSAAIRKLFSNT